jgi:prophage regulatory protein
MSAEQHGTTTYEIWRLPKVLERTGISRTKLYELISKNDFPRQIKLGIGPKSRSVGWRSCDVMQWLDQQAVAAGYNVEEK